MLKEIDYKKAERLAAQGMTLKQIALALGVTQDTLYKRRKTHPKFEECIKRGQAKGLAVITNALYENAKGGNFSAQQFYLRCRDRDNWNDKDPVGDITHDLPSININFVEN